MDFGWWIGKGGILYEVFYDDLLDTLSKTMMIVSYASTQMSIQKKPQSSSR